MRPPLTAMFAVLVVLVVTTGLLPAAAEGSDPRPAFGDTTAPLRPGASYGGYCSFNWVFYDSVLEEDEDPKGYIGTAGHCTDELGEVANLPGYGRVGTVVYDSDLVESGVDFSLIRLDDDVIADTNPTMRGWDGPYGSITEADLSTGDVVDQHGYGMVLGENGFTRSRSGVLVNWTDDEYVVDGPFVNGDSGSPLLHRDTGAALGIISRYGFSAFPPATDTGPLMSFIFAELATAGFGDVVLADAS